jgi:hypothetical protein
LISPLYCLLDVVDRTHQDEFTKFAVSSSRTHGVAKRARDRREDGFTHRSLMVLRPIDPGHNARIDGPELTMFD